MVGEVLLWAELGLAGLSLAPFAIHRASISTWAKDSLQCPDEDSNMQITVILPVWNEALIIESKLADLASQTIDVELLVIDSASSDDTVKLVENWLADHPDAFLSSKLIRMEKRLGKTTAVMQALDELSDVEGIIVMTDADASLGKGSFERIRRWFSDATVGAVGGTPHRRGGIGAEKTHRDMYTMIRLGESAYDSTPFLEGSILAWRAGAVCSADLHATANADDAQIATAVRLGGLRAIQDSALIFTDHMPTTSKGQRRQKVRRAQGIVRLLARKRSHWFSRRHGRYSTILRRNAWMHLLSPLLMSGAALTALMRNVVGDQILWLTGIEIYCVVSWLLMRQGKSILGFQIAGTILSGMENLLSAILMSARGKSLHIWEQHTDVRNELVRNRFQ